MHLQSNTSIVHTFALEPVAPILVPQEKPRLAIHLEMKAALTEWTNLIDHCKRYLSLTVCT